MTVTRPFPALRRALHHLAFWSTLAVAAVVVAVAGLDVRAWAWRETEPIRFVQDIDNAFRQGTYTAAFGYLDRYDHAAYHTRLPFIYNELDYGPGRLAIATVWARWVRDRVDAPRTGPDRYTSQWYVEFYARARQLDATAALCRPMLTVNLIGEAASAAAVFLLVRRFSSAGGGRRARGGVLGLVAAALFWLDPALISNAHCWPQWDSWVLPFLLWAAVAASAEWWFAAGALVGLGAMFKGQVLFSAVWFLLWPLFRGRVGAMARWAAGLATALAVATAVWDVRSPGHLYVPVAWAGHVERLAVGPPPTTVRPAAHETAYQPGQANPAAVNWVVESVVAFAIIALAVRARAGWVDRDPSVGRVAAGVGMTAAGLAAAVALAAGGLAGAAGSAGGDGVLIALAAVPAAWSAWVAGVLPSWPGRRVPRPVSVVARAVAATAGIVVVGWPLWHAGLARVGPVAAAGVGLAVVLWAVPARAVATVGAAWAAGAVLLCVPLFGGSGQWFTVGVAHGTTARVGLALGPDNNLAALLQDVWQWHLEDPVDTRLTTLEPGPTAERVSRFLVGVDPKAKLPPTDRPLSLPLKYVLVGLWAGLTAASAVGAARHGGRRRRHPRFLLAVAGPWLAMFAVMGQMHQRYLLWGAALTCMAVAVSPGLVLPHVLLAVVAAGQEMLSMIEMADRDPSRAAAVDAWTHDHATLVSIVQGWTPGMGWAVLTITGLVVYLSVAGRGRPDRITGSV